MKAIFLFYNRSYGVCSKFSFGSKYKHCSVIMYDGENYIMSWINRLGIQNKIIHIDHIDDHLQKLQHVENIKSFIVVDIKKRKRTRWFPVSINSCNELCRKVSGIDIGPTFNVSHFHNEIISKDEKRNFTIKHYWETE